MKSPRSFCQTDVPNAIPRGLCVRRKNNLDYYIKHQDLIQYMPAVQLRDLVMRAISEIEWLRGNSCDKLMSDLVRAYEREVDPVEDWRQTALTKDEFDSATKEYRFAKQWLRGQNKP